MSIRSFLEELKSKFEKNLHTSSVTYFVTIGNEASDLDSIASSILLAFFLSKLRISHGNEVYLPIMNIPQEGFYFIHLPYCLSDFSLRTETTWLFSELGLNKNDLIYYPDVESKLDALNSQNRLALILVDHNILANHQNKYAKAVYQIIDHHKDEKLYSEVRILLFNLMVADIPF